MHEYQLRATLAAFSRDGRLSTIAAITGFQMDRIERFIDGKKIAPTEVVILKTAVDGLRKVPTEGERIASQFEKFASAYKYDLRKDDEGEYVRASTKKAFVAYRNGFLDCMES